MWKPTKFSLVPLGVAALCLVASALLFAGATRSDAPPTVVRAGPQESEGYQVRCWQYGQLLFEENNLDVSDATIRRSFSFQRSRGTASPVYLFETRNATCLAKPSEIEHKQP